MGHKLGDFRVDIGSSDSIKKLYEAVGPVDAVVSAAGVAKFAPLDQLTEDDFLLSANNKLMGQVNLVRIGARYLRDNGSFTVTSGVLSRQPMKGSHGNGQSPECPPNSVEGTRRGEVLDTRPLRNESCLRVARTVGGLFS